MTLKSCASAEDASCSAVGAEGGRKPQRFIILSSCPTLALSCARVNPHHAGEAYVKDKTMHHSGNLMDGRRRKAMRTKNSERIHGGCAGGKNLVKMLPHPKIRVDGDAKYSDGADT